MRRSLWIGGATGLVAALEPSWRGQLLAGGTVTACALAVIALGTPVSVVAALVAARRSGEPGLAPGAATLRSATGLVAGFAAGVALGLLVDGTPGSVLAPYTLNALAPLPTWAWTIGAFLFGRLIPVGVLYLVLAFFGAAALIGGRTALRARNAE